MNAAEIESLIRELVQGIQQVVQSGEELDDEFQGLLAQALSGMLDKLDEARENERQPNQGQNADAQLLWILAGQQPQAFISYLRTYPTPATQALLQNPAQLNQTIESLQRSMPAGEPLVVDGVQQADLNSSNIWGTAYNPRTGKLKVRFQGGSEYEYDGVPANIYKAFVRGNASARTKGKNRYGEWWVGKNPSLGAALNQYIKAGAFPYRRIR